MNRLTLINNPERWITWLVGRRRTQQTARHCVKCRSHEHRHVERTLLARNPSVSGHVHPRVGIDSNTNQYELGRLSRSLSRGSDSSRPSVLPANPPLAGCGSFGLHGSSSVLHARECVVCRRLLKYLFFFFEKKKLFFFSRKKKKPPRFGVSTDRSMRCVCVRASGSPFPRCTLRDRE